MTTDNLFNTDFFLDQLPEGYYQQFVERKQPRQQHRRLSKMFSDIQGEYNKSLAKFAVDNPGVSPLKRSELSTWAGFLENFNLGDKFFDAAPWEREPDRQAFNPRTQFLYDR